MTLAEQLASLKGATIENISAKLNKENTELFVITFFLTDGRKVEFSSYVSYTGDYIRAAESAIDIEIR